jgi:hypothetical protein
MKVLKVKGNKKLLLSVREIMDLLGLSRNAHGFSCVIKRVTVITPYTRESSVLTIKNSSTIIVSEN